FNTYGISGDWEFASESVSEGVVGEVREARVSRSVPENDENQGNQVLYFQALMNLKVHRPKGIVKNLVYERQNVLLLGRFVIGKTMLGTHLYLHLATGREFLGLAVPRPFRTMYLDFENDLGDIRDRLSKQTDNLRLSREENALLNHNWIYVDAGDDDHPLHGIKLDGNKTGLERLISLLTAHRPEVLIIDNLGLVATKGDLNDPEEAARFYDNLKYLRSEILFTADALNDRSKINATPRLVTGGAASDEPTVKCSP